MNEKAITCRSFLVSVLQKMDAWSFHRRFFEVKIDVSFKTITELGSISFRSPSCTQLVASLS